MPHNYLAHIQSLYALRIQPTLGAPKGSSHEKVDRLERALGHALPIAYRQFLLWMGDDAEGVYRGSNCFTDNVVRNNRYLPQLLKENNMDFILPPAYVVFFLHQGYMAAWFDLPAHTDNPPVWFYSETDDGPVPRMTGTFIEAIEADLQSLALAQDKVK